MTGKLGHRRCAGAADDELGLGHAFRQVGEEGGTSASMPLSE